MKNITAYLKNSIAYVKYRTSWNWKILHVFHVSWKPNMIVNDDITWWCYFVQGFTVKPHYFAPLLKNAADRGDVDGKKHSC